MTVVAEPQPKDSGGPLNGLVVLDISRVLSGPYCTMMLRDLGALVIKVEQPGTGDEARHFLPLTDTGESAYFASINRGKKSIALDLKATSDRAVFRQLLSRADVLVENFRPGVLAKLGYGFDALEAQFPSLVVASISGFGQTGPYRNRPAYDVVVQAMSGMMSITGHPGTPPVRCGSSIGDLTAAVFACNGIQAALLQRCRTGKGCHVDVSMLEAQVAFLESAIPEVFCTGRSPGPVGARHRGTAPFDAFKAKDGYLVIAAGSDHLFASLAAALGRSDLASDPRYATRADRVSNQIALKAVIEALLTKETVSHWVDQLDALGVPAGPLNDTAEMMADEQVQNRGILPEIKGTGGQRTAVTPILLSTHAYPAILPAVPRLDEHRDEILRFAREGTLPLS